MNRVHKYQVESLGEAADLIDNELTNERAEELWAAFKHHSSDDKLLREIRALLDKRVADSGKP
ncbi:hypothetical protein [Xanthomonas citri]|uniref:hypothetical protein n=1 Tax=Xanthomonas citri TaxID=346 RepID=UPI00103A87E8|nr:hypothetical protein [Xanthomonas citri]